MRKRGLTLQEIKKDIKSKQGDCVNLKVHLGRNKFITYSGIIENVYPAVFTVKSQNLGVKAYSYSGVACKEIAIK